MKQDAVDSAREGYGPVWVGRNKQKSEWWKDEFKAVMEKIKVFLKDVLKAREDFERKMQGKFIGRKREEEKSRRGQETYIKEKRKKKEKKKKETNEQFQER